ncbi:unnamed protein product [Miscanthus lutarioriparius]|uniref:Uncharacterized protein n=1 Tax=Miscanthus lutarioriparius TaxID=422564 RepID=A0A811RTE9_9POAL|nr:unnamed protein product [Miscanthus lutarioriparius]
MVELSGLFLRHGLAVTIVVVEPPAASTDASTAVARAAEANPSVNFHVLPLPPPDTTVSPEPPRDPFALLRLANAPLRDYLRSVAPSASVRALVFDFFCIDALDVAAELGVPAYLFYTSGACSLAVSLPAQAGRGVLGEDQSPGAGSQVMGAAGGRAPAQGNGHVRHPLRVALGAGGDSGRRAAAVLAAVRGAEAEQGVHGGGGEGWGGDGRILLKIMNLVKMLDSFSIRVLRFLSAGKWKTLSIHFHLQ